MNWWSGHAVVYSGCTYVLSEADAEEPFRFEDEPDAVAEDDLGDEDDAPMAASIILILSNATERRGDWSGRGGRWWGRWKAEVSARPV